MKCTCDKTKGQACLHCLKAPPAMRVDVIPYRAMMKEKRAMCHFSHAPTATCGACADEPMPVFKGKANCDRGHAPWPQGVCLACAPPNANLRLQKYRHCDIISFVDARCIVEFYKAWFRSGQVSPRAGILFGRYSDEPDTTQLQGAVRANVYALYVPPQQGKHKMLEFAPDKNERVVHTVAAAMGLEPLGWVTTTMPRAGAQYGGQVLMSGAEIRQAATFQSRFADEKGHSRFVSVVVEHGANVEPKAYQVSDQCVALQRDGILALPSDPYLLATPVPTGSALMPKIVYKDKPLVPGKEFVPDEFLVKVIVSQAAGAKGMFKYNDFPAQSSLAELKDYLKRHAADDLMVRLSDFNCLCLLATTRVGEKLACRAAADIASGKPFDDALRAELDKLIREL